MRARIGTLVLDAVYPPDTNCFACGAEAVLDAQLLCAACAARIRRAGEFRKPPAGLQGAYAPYYYDRVLHGCIYRFKYGEDQYLAAPLAAQMQLPNGCAPDCIVPVPLHATRLKQRGFNQSALLAANLAARCGIHLAENMLRRIRPTTPQASLQADARAKNLHGAFQSRDAQGLTILLVDDLVTSGSTLTACAEALKEAGAVAVYASCACRVE